MKITQHTKSELILEDSGFWITWLLSIAFLLLFYAAKEGKQGLDPSISKLVGAGRTIDAIGLLRGMQNMNPTGGEIAHQRNRERVEELT